METIIIEILIRYKELTTLSEGDFDYLIPGDMETLQDIAREIMQEIAENSA